jgi:hypothetical protein
MLGTIECVCFLAVGWLATWKVRTARLIGIVHVQRRLSLRPGAQDPSVATASAALRTRHCLAGNYNGGSVLIAPYLLYERHGVPHLAGVTLTRDSRELRGDKLSEYRLPGIQNLSLTSRAFAPEAALLSTHSHAVDRVLATVLDTAPAPHRRAEAIAASPGGGSDHG